ncbi:hypothetical protein F4778DRAFT_790710 [Xylariomycetidae sp. FL2044]|nr:hypothetical protein F4778DRAFT_790710 [Xylariomycetidae sp. FL2044]
MFRLNLNGYFCHLLEYIYALPEPPRRERTRPMEVICVGLPRCGTESLQHALVTLGYDPTCHGWDIVLEAPNRCQQWAALARRKWFGPRDGNTQITAADFDALLGDAVAVTDTASSVFAAEMIRAYPEAKVILNQRSDVDAWHRSITGTIGRAEGHWPLFLMSCLGREVFWAWHAHCRLMYPGLFRAIDGDIGTGIARNGKWVYREHYDMVRGLVPAERRLEWTVEDGWEPLCAFLGKPVPDLPFPNTNSAAGWAGKESREMKRFAYSILEGLGVIGAVGLAVGLAVKYYR